MRQLCIIDYMISYLLLLISIIIGVTIAAGGPSHRPVLLCARASKVGTKNLHLMQWKRQCQKIESKNGMRW